MPQPLLSGQQEYVEPVSDLQNQIDALETRVAELEANQGQVKRDAVLALLNLLAQSLRHVASGQMDIAESVPPQASAPQFDPQWQAWKQKLGGNTAPAKVIDALLTHGPLNRTQLRSAAELGWSTLDAATARLKNLSLIEKSGDRWNLKS
jgi:hypothetical protein